MILSRVRVSLIRRLTGLAVAGLVAVSSLTVQAAGPLDLIPDAASVVVRLKAPEGTITKVGNFANNVQPGLGFLVQGNAPALGVLISNPTLNSVDLKQDWFVAVFPVKGGEPAVVFLVSSTNVDAMKEAVGDSFTFASKDSWVAYSQDAAVMELVEECLDGGSKGVSSSIDARSSEVFDAGDLSVFVNVASLVETYADEIDAADEQVDGLIEGFAAQLPASPGMNLEPVVELYGKMGHSVLQGVKDSQAFTFALSVSNQALTFEELLLVRGDTGTDRFLKRHETADLAVLNRLPQDRLGYMALHMNLKSVMEWGMDFAGKVFGTDSDIATKMEKVKTEMKSVELGSLAMGFNLKDAESGVMEVWSLMEATPAEKLRALTRELGSAFKFELPGVKQEISLEKDAEKYGDLTVDVMTVTQEFDEEADPLGFQKKFQQVAYGENGMIQRITTKDGHVIQTQGGDEETMKAALAAFDSTSGGADSATGKARARLLTNANVVGLIDLPNMAVRIVQIASRAEVLPIPLPEGALDNLKIAPSYIGFSAGTEAQGIRMKSEIPAKSIQGIMQLVNFFQTMQRQQNQNF